MLDVIMRSSYRGLALVLPVVLSACASTSSPAASGTADAEFVGFITDTECGANHAPMIARGSMGKDDRECTLICVRKGATFGFVDADSRRFSQLDDQDAPAPYAGRKVRIRGRRQGDTIFVKSVAPAD
jgi:hypothetical protein